MMTVMLQKADLFQGDLILVSAAHPLLYPATELTPAAEQFSEVLLHVRAQHALSGLLGVLNCGSAIVPVSAYRSHAEQIQLYRDCLLEHGPLYTGQFVALPGCSEHQTGLAIDLGENGPELDYIAPSFPDIGPCRNFRQLAPQFGFIRRYEASKEALTGIADEPWHFRYVGCPHSEIMEQDGMCLEEYLQWLRNFSQDRPLCRNGTQIFFVPYRPGWSLQLPEDAEYTVSGNNIDGCIVTLWEAVP